MRKFAIFTVCCALTMLTTLLGCERGPGKLAPAEVPTLPVAQPVSAEITDFIDYTGRANTKDPVTIQPRVTGYLEKLPFKEGADVKKGDLLCEIDPRPYEAQVDAAKAAVAQNLASLNYAIATNKRYKELKKIDPAAVSERELDQYQALEEQAIANLKLAKANLASAELNLGFTKYYSPINGRISRYYLTPGNLVNQDSTIITTVVSMDPIYVYFDMDEPTLLRINRAINEGKISASKKDAEDYPWLDATARFGLSLQPWLSGPQRAAGAGFPLIPDTPVLMGLQGEDGYPHHGTVNFYDNQVNPGTGSILVRGVFPNPRPPGGAFMITPGMFVRVHFPIGQPQMELLVIDRAVYSEQGVKYLYVIDKDNKVKQQTVTLGALQEDGLRVITKGIKKDDWVLIGGLQQVRPETTINPNYVTMPSLKVGATAVPEKAAAEKAKTPKKGKR